MKKFFISIVIATVAASTVSPVHAATLLTLSPTSHCQFSQQSRENTDVVSDTGVISQTVKSQRSVFAAVNKTPAINDYPVFFSPQHIAVFRNSMPSVGSTNAALASLSTSVHPLWSRKALRSKKVPQNKDDQNLWKAPNPIDHFGGPLGISLGVSAGYVGAQAGTVAGFLTGAIAGAAIAAESAQSLDAPIIDGVSNEILIMSAGMLAGGSLGAGASATASATAGTSGVRLLNDLRKAPAPIKKVPKKASSKKAPAKKAPAPLMLPRLVPAPMITISLLG